MADDETGILEGEAFIDSIVDKYAAEDQKNMDAEDGIEDEGDGQGEDTDDSGDDDSAGDAEHPATGTSAAHSDGNADEADDESAKDDEDEHPDDDDEEDSDAADDSATDDDATDEATQETADEQEISATTKALLEKHGAKLTLDDLPAEARPLVAAKLKGVDQAFSRAMQEQTAWRAERTKAAAEEKFRAENPDMVIVEMLRANPELAAKVDARLDKIEDPDLAEAFDLTVKDKRQKAADAVAEEEKTANAQAAIERRTGEIVTTGKKLAADAGLPWATAEMAIELALRTLPEGKYDLTDGDLASVIATHALAYKRTTQRPATRAASKELVKKRTETRRTAPQPAKRPASATSPRPAAKEEEEIDWNDSESRQRAMMRTIRRVAPGTK